jgi:3-hydroxyisobutyrate dehydrogenase-like beta-hydroxyacid dehydrogenase
MPIFEAMGKNIFHLGRIGMGQVFKLVNNIALLVNQAGLSEALTFGQRAGLNLDRMLEVLKVSSGNSWVVENYDLMASHQRDFQKRGFASPMAMGYKDLDLALAYARELEIFALPIVGLISQTDVSTVLPAVGNNRG